MLSRPAAPWPVLVGIRGNKPRAPGAHDARFIKRFVEEAGSQKVVLGSTYYSSPPSYRKNHALDLILEAGLPEQHLANLLALNVTRLFKLNRG